MNNEHDHKTYSEICELCTEIKNVCDDAVDRGQADFDDLDIHNEIDWAQMTEFYYAPDDWEYDVHGVDIDEASVTDN